MTDRRRESFDLVAADYDRFRAAPPRAVVGDLVGRAGLAPGSRVVEVGCGTGQLSVALARAGVDLTAVELGPHLAERARRHLARYPHARVEVADFERWAPPGGLVDAVVGCNCFHWLDPAVWLDRVAALLRPGGALGVIHVTHVAGGTPGMVAATQPLYVAYGLSDDPDFVPPAASAVAEAYLEIDGHRSFEMVSRRRFLVRRRFATAAYLGLLRTDSLVNTLEPGARDGFLREIGRVVDGLGGTLSRRFIYEVIVARRRA